VYNDDSVRPLSIAVNRGGWRQYSLFECYWNLSVLDTDTVHSPAFKRRWWRLNADNLWLRLNACEHVQRHQWERYINFGLVTIGLLVCTVKYGRAFWTVSYHDILCSIVLYPSFSFSDVFCHHHYLLCWAVSSLAVQEIGRKERLQNDLLCVCWDIKRQSVNQSVLWHCWLGDKKSIQP